MKLRMHFPSGALEPVDDNGNTLMITIPLAYDGPSREELSVRIATDERTKQGPVWTFAIPAYWIADAVSRAFYFDGGPVSLGDVLDDDSAPGAVARADTPAYEDPSFETLRVNLHRRLALTRSGERVFERLLRQRLPKFIQTLIEDSVAEVRDEEEKKLGLPIPWSERPVPLRQKPGGQPNHLSLRYYLEVRARQLQTRESLLTIFAESDEEERAKTRYYDGRRIYLYLRFLR